MKREVCPICGNTSVRFPRPDLMPHPYVQCTGCDFYYQQELRPKVYEASHEQPGNLMDQRERDINKHLAEWLYNDYVKNQAGTLCALDIGSKYPWLSHCLGNLGVESVAIDGIPEILKFCAEDKLNVTAYQYDFESLEKAYPWGEQRFNLITMVHMIEHLYHPIESMHEVHHLLLPGGVLFIRCPSNDIEGIERDFTRGHYDIHPQIWGTRSLLILADKLNMDIEYLTAFHGQRDIVLRKK